MELESFLRLSTVEAAGLVRSGDPVVCAFPINGTRRWFLLEYPPETWQGEDFLTAYLQASVRRQVDLFHLFFDHGIDTLMMPLFGPDLLERGPGYMAMAAAALRQLCEDPIFLNCYREKGLRVHFYGDYRRFLMDTPYAALSDLFDQLSRATEGNRRGRLLFGVFGNDPTERIAEISVEFFRKHQRLPVKRELVAAYFGEEVPPVSLFIGFDRFSAFDMPLIATGSEDLYFTVSPSPYLSEQQLRAILYDHLYARRAVEPDYEALSPEAVQRMREFYADNQDHTLGVGVVRDGFWYPLSQVTLPNSFSTQPGVW